ncbi:DHHW family protein [Clostridium aminobutyricum]|uniref:DHHW protein n=1 Tax=Clostridium aminobutyricum TaxID=33953 RepID=A0A939II58_CLOAM|nr:DHHW family protein [Clostridium aminobutyricum]MBN7774582.1 hypothetical protein [Clostridium aminobutyricum]
MGDKYNLENINNRITTIVFVLILVLILILCILIPDKRVSENENRPLQPLPHLTINGIVDGSYMKAFENYVSDQMVGRDAWTEFKNNVDIASGKKDNGSVYYGKDGYLFSIETEDDVQLAKNIQYTNSFLELARNENPALKISVLIAPTSTAVLDDKLPAHAPVFDQAEALKQVEKGLQGISYEPLSTDKENELRAYVNVLPDLKEQRETYVYYRTDHHWTTLGAYYAYKAWQQHLGTKPPQLNEFRVKTVSGAFYGTSYSKAVSAGLIPDSMERFDYKDENNACSMQVTLQGKTRNLQGLYDEQYLNKKDKYSYFLSGNNALTTIHTGIKNGKKILVIKDSYAHCFIPFLTKDFETIVAVDMRYYKQNPAKLIKEENITDLLILYNIVQYTNDRNFVFLSKM